MANTTNGCLAADAAAHLRQSGCSTGGFNCTSAEIEKQCGFVIEWAKKGNHFLTADCHKGLQKHGDTTAEHDVYYRKSDNRALKITYAGTFGVTPESKGIQKAATPAFYLERLELMNEHFKSDFRLEGVLMGKSMILGAGEQPSFVVSQPWMDAKDVKEVHPTEKEITDFMTKMGFTPVPKSFFGWEKPGLLILDAKPDNFIKTTEGLVPIDLVIARN